MLINGESEEPCGLKLTSVGLKSILSSSAETDVDSSGEDSGQTAGDQEGKATQQQHNNNKNNLLHSTTLIQEDKLILQLEGGARCVSQRVKKKESTS